MANYALDFQDISKSYVGIWKDGEPPQSTTLETDKDVLKLLDRFSPDDEIFMELGGSGNVIAYLALSKGARVHRIPTYLIKAERDARQVDKIQDHLIIVDMARQKAQLFYDMVDVDRRIVELWIYVRARKMVQKDVRIPTELRLTRIARDLWYIRQPEQALEKYIEEAIYQNPIFKGAEVYEDELTKNIAKILHDIPLYDNVFAPIRGCGPVIAGTIIARIGDIRRFPTPATLKSYAGYHVIDGHMPKLKRGEKITWDPTLRQAIWLFTDVTNKQPEGTPWKDMQLRRKAYLAEKYPDMPKYRIQKNALRYVGTKFVVFIWKEWRRFAGLPTNV